MRYLAILCVVILLAGGRTSVRFKEINQMPPEQIAQLSDDDMCEAAAQHDLYSHSTLFNV